MSKSSLQSHRPALLTLAALVLAGASAGPARAQSNAGPASLPAPTAASEAVSAQSAADPVAEFERTLQTRVMTQVADLVGLAERVLTLRPHHLAARYLLGVSALEDGALNLALRQFDQAEDIRHKASPSADGSATATAAPHPDLFAPATVHWPSLIAYRRAQCLGFMGRHDQQQAALRDYLGQGFDQHETANSVEQPAVLLLAASCVKTGRFTEADKLLQRAERDRLGGWQFERALYERFRNPDEAEARRLLDQMIQEHGGSQEPACPLSWVFLRAIVSLRSGEPELAAQLLEVCLRRQKEQPLFFPRLVQAQVSLSAGDLPAARQTLAACWVDLDLMRPLDRRDNRRRLLLTTAQFYLVAGHPERGADICARLMAEPVRFGANTTQNASGWRAALYLTACCCEKARPSGGLLAAAQSAMASRDLQARLYHEMDQMLRGPEYHRDPFDFMDAPVWLWPALERVTSPALISALRAEARFHGWRKSAYTSLIDFLSTGEAARSTLIPKVQADLPLRDALTLELLTTPSPVFFPTLAKLRISLSDHDHHTLTGTTPP